MSPAPHDSPEPGDRLDLADIVARAALSVPGVARMHSGSFGEVATYLAGRRVDGVRLRPGATEVHLVFSPGTPILSTAQQVRTEVAALVSGSVDIYVEDLGEDFDTPGAPPPSTPVSTSPQFRA